MNLFSNKGQDSPRYILAIFLSAGVLISWYLFNPPVPPARPAPATVSGNEEKKTESSILQIPATNIGKFAAKKPKSVPLTPLLEKAAARPFVPEKTFHLKNNYLSLTLTTKNAAVIDAAVRYGGAEGWSENIERFHNPSFPTGKLAFETLTPPSPPLFFTGKQQGEKKLQFKTYLQFKDAAFSLEKTYRIDEYSLFLDVAIQPLNAASHDVALPKFYVVNGSSLGDFSKKSVFDINNISYEMDTELNNVLQNSFFSMFSEDSQTELRVRKKTDWISQDNRFFARVLKPLTTVEEAYFYKLSRSETEEENTPYLISSYLVAPVVGQDASFQFFFLPKRRDLLNKFHDTQGEYFFNLFQQFKFMRILSSLMYWLLELINGVLKNYGWSIFILTLLVKSLTFPLTYKGMKSMQRMQELAPKLEALKKNYKKNSQKLNQEMMRLYQKEGVSPLGGCLPMFIPIPFFIALYSLFQNMVELKGVPFYWISDLSLPDVIYQFNFNIPFLGSQFHLLPVIMLITAFLQSFINPSAAPTTPENKTQILMMKYLMPFFFFFISWSMPSALVLFWTIQNIFSILQTYLLKISRKKLSLS